MNELVLPCTSDTEDNICVNANNGILRVGMQIEGIVDYVFLSKDSVQQLADYLTAWLGEAE